MSTHQSASDLLVRALVNEGVQRIFAVPGEENIDVLESLRLSPIEVVVCRHEQAAGFMAATEGRLTGRPGVCLATLGPGATNLITAAAHANLGAMPMVMITGQKPIRSGEQGEFQRLAVTDVMRPVTKYTKQINSGQLIPSRVREAFRLAREERPGATHLELPEDVALDEVDAGVLNPTFTRRPVAEEKSLDRAWKAIEAARRPMLVLGAGANRNLTCKALRTFVAQTGMPFATTQMGKGVVDENSDSFIGCAALSSGDFVHRAIEDSDLLVNVGHDVVEKPPFIVKHGMRVIHVNYIPAQIEPIYFPEIEVVGDIAQTFEHFATRLSSSPSWDFSPLLEWGRRMHQDVRDSLERNALEASALIAPEAVVDVVSQALGSTGRIVLDNGLYKLLFARNYYASHARSVLLDNALATMGAGLPSAIASRIISPEHPVICVCGDGGFAMNMQDLETAVRLRLRLIVLVLRDDCFGMIRWKQQSRGYPDFGLSFDNLDVVTFAKACRTEGLRASTLSELKEALNQEFLTGVRVVEVPIDYKKTFQDLSEGIAQRSNAKG